MRATEQVRGDTHTHTHTHAHTRRARSHALPDTGHQRHKRACTHIHWDWVNREKESARVRLCMCVGGSSGWQAPEQLIARGGGQVRQTRSMDVFSLGCVLHFCMTGGKHPFGDSFERDMTILRGQPNVAPLQPFPEACNLVRVTDAHIHTRARARAGRYAHGSLLSFHLLDARIWRLSAQVSCKGKSRPCLTCVCVCVCVCVCHRC